MHSVLSRTCPLDEVDHRLEQLFLISLEVLGSINCLPTQLLHQTLTVLQHIRCIKQSCVHIPALAPLAVGGIWACSASSVHLMRRHELALLHLSPNIVQNKCLSQNGYGLFARPTFLNPFKKWGGAANATPYTDILEPIQKMGWGSYCYP